MIFSPLMLAASFDDMADMDISDLMYMEVTSVSKKSQKLSEAAASIYVLTQEDLRRSAANSVPEALRMVPGLSVAQLDANKWAISARGFNHLYSNKLLVLVDGVTVYSPLFSGVHWEAQDLLIEDIDRIEVIRGPGATLWGANAVNGVINITTKHAQETYGIQITQRIGTNDKTITSGRYGGRMGENGHYRVFGKVRQTRANVDSKGNEAADDWEQARLGMRADWQKGENNSFTIQVNHYTGVNGETLSTPINPLPFFGDTRTTFEDELEVSGTNILGRWSHNFNNHSELSVQSYLDTQSRKDIFEEKHDTYDFDFQHRIKLGNFQEFIWGGGYRIMKSKTAATPIDANGVSVTSSGTPIYSFNPANRNTKLANFFVQDEITLSPDMLMTVIGVKVEKNDFTNLEIQPNARIIWTPTKRQSYWAAISRAVRTPALNDSDARINSGVQAANPDFGSPTSLIMMNGNPDFKSEELTAYELGYRSNPFDELTIDASLFYHDYTNLQGAVFKDFTFPFTNLQFVNNQKAIAKGLELSINWQPNVRWKLLAGYSYLDLDQEVEGTADAQAIAIANAQAKESPKHQFQLRSYFDINHELQLNTMFYHVGALEVRDFNNPGLDNNQKVSRYNRLDMNVSWQTNKFIKLTAGVNNLLQKHHAEFANVPFVNATEVERSIYAKVNIELQ